MKYLYWVFAVFVIIALIDRIFGEKLGLSKELEKGVMLFGTLFLSMVGMIIIAPFISWCLEPLVGGMEGILDPSFLSAILLANDMGGAQVSSSIANDPTVGGFNGLVVGSMMGATVSCVIPFSVGIVPKNKQSDMAIGFMVGIITVPLGAFVGGLVAGISFLALIVNLLPLTIFSIIVAIGLWFKPNVCVKIFSVVGLVLKVIVTIGLGIGIFEFLTQVDIPHTTPLTEATELILSVVCFLAGAFPILLILSKILRKPLKWVEKKTGMNGVSVSGFLCTVASPFPTFASMDKMDRKGVILNTAFSVSATCVFADHLAFTLAFDPTFLPSMLVAKLAGGVIAILAGLILYKRIVGQEPQTLIIEK